MTSKSRCAASTALLAALLVCPPTLWSGVERSLVFFNAEGEATFTKDYGGDAAYPYRCRMPSPTRLLCIYDAASPGHAVEFRRTK